MGQKYKTQIRIHFRDADPAQIMYFGNLPSLAHDIFEEFIVATGYTWKEWFKGSTEMIPIRHLEVDYLAPFIPGETYEVEAHVENLGSTSFKMKYRFFKNELTCANLTMVHAVLDTKTKQKKELPETMRTRLERYAQ